MSVELELKYKKFWIEFFEPPPVYVFAILSAVKLLYLFPFPESNLYVSLYFVGSMADFAADLSKIVSEKKFTGGAGKAGKNRKLATKSSAVFGSASSSPVGASSSLGTKVVSPYVTQKTKLIKGEIPLVDLEVEKPFLLPRVISDKDFLEKNPL